MSIASSFNGWIGIVIGALAIVAAFAVVTRRSNQRLSERLSGPMRLALLFLVIAFFGVTLAMFGSYVGYRSPLFALIAAADILGVIALMRPVFPWRLPGSLLTVRGWERSGRLYRMSGVASFGAALRHRPLCYLNSMVYLGAHRGALGGLRSSILRSEGVHFWAVVATIPFLACAVFLGWWDSVLWVIAFQFVFNLYPVFHLRYVRGRLERVMSRSCAATLCKGNP